MSSRLAGIPLDHVAAEIAAYPFASVASFELGATELDSRGGGRGALLWRRAEGSLIGGFPSFSLDEIVALRDRTWFADPSDAPVPLDAYLRRVARALLTDDGVTARPAISVQERWQRADPNTHASLARRAWHWLSLALPGDLVLGALGDATRGPSRIDTMSPVLARHLADHGFAETHLHIGAALDFDQLWANAMRVIGRPEVKAGSFRSAGAELEEGASIAPWLVRAALARLLLGAFLASAHGDFITWLHGGVRQQLVTYLGPAGYSLVLRMIQDLLDGRMRPGSSFESCQASYARIIGRGPSRTSTCLDPLELDPLTDVLDRHDRSGRTAEVQLVAGVLERLERNRAQGTRDHGLTALFWQVVRVRSLFFRHVVHRPLTPGLLWFVRFYNRSKAARRSLSTRTQMECARRICGDGDGLRSLEFRTAPGSSRSDQQEYVQEIAEVASTWRTRDGQSQGLEVGLVLHFIKTRAGGVDEGRPAAHWCGTNADPGAAGSRNGTGFRYARFYAQQRCSATSVEWLLRHRPAALTVLRGFDVCTDEVAVPAWVIAPLLRRVRAAAQDGAQAFQRCHGWSPPLPRTTAHAGEDFVHLLTGMRLLDEAIEGFELGAGDRIGHGLSLGVEPGEWARRTAMVPIAREDRLFDLVWEWQFYARYGGCPDASRLARIERDIAALAEVIFDLDGDQAYAARDIESLWRDLLDPWRLYEIGFPSAPNPRAVARRDRRTRLLLRHLSSREVFRRGRTLIWIETAPEATVLEQLQAQLRRKTGALGITIEVNPTSNLLIGDLNDLTRHPLWRLRPFRPSADDPPPLSVCIGSDDPLVFNSGLRQEYQRLYDAMKLAGCSEEETHRWLDRTRAAGMETRFTLERTAGSIRDWYAAHSGRAIVPI